MRNHKSSMSGIRYVVSISIAFPLTLLISLIIGFIAGSLFNYFSVEEISSIVSYCFMGAGIGGGIGLIQWKFFKRQLTISIKWITTSVIAFAMSELAAGLALWAIGSTRDFELDNQGLFIYFLIYTVGGALAGLMQTRFFTHKVLNPRVWFVASTAGWGIAFLFLLISNFAYGWFSGAGSLSMVFVLVSILITGMLLGIITGSGMKRMLHQKDLHL